MVDRSLESSLESLAADRGITICFVDLEGADGLWLPEERTILLARGLSSREAADVLQHELSHVDIEDGHAALDAATHRRVGRTRWAVAGTAAASLALLFGIRAQLHPTPAGDSHPAPPVAVAPSHTPAAGQPTPAATQPTKLVMVNGEVRTQTVTVTPPAPSGTSLANRPASTTVGAGAGATPTLTNGPMGSTPTGTPDAGGATETTTAPTTTPPSDSASPTPTLFGTGAGGP